MIKLNLKDVTLICIDDMLPDKASKIMEGVCERINFGEVKLLSSKEGGFVTDKIKSFINIKSYNIFVIKEIYKYINTDFCMIIQRDGYPLNYEMWTNQFLKYDYIGAPWTWAPPEHQRGVCRLGKCVGNGGFSIRSSKLLQEIASYDYDAKYPEEFGGQLMQEDIFTCQWADDRLKSKGITYAPVELAHYFSVENQKYESQFGFHGGETIKLNKELGIFTFKDHAYE
jgi:hypothetical protein